MSEEEVIYILTRVKSGFRFAIIETCPSIEVPFAIGYSKVIPDLLIKRFAQDDLDIEFSLSREDAIKSVLETFGIRENMELQKTDNLLCGRKLLRGKQSVIFSIDYSETSSL